jgi:hypothetical protein
MLEPVILGVLSYLTQYVCVCMYMCVFVHIYVYTHHLLLFFSSYIKYILNTTKYYTRLENEKGNSTNYRICFWIIYNLIIEHMKCLDGYMDLVDISIAR